MFPSIGPIMRTILVSDRGNPTEEEKKNHENHAMWKLPEVSFNSRLQQHLDCRSNRKFWWTWEYALTSAYVNLARRRISCETCSRFHFCFFDWDFRHLLFKGCYILYHFAFCWNFGVQILHVSQGAHFIIGGDGTHRGAHEMAELMKEKNWNCSAPRSGIHTFTACLNMSEIVQRPKSGIVETSYFVWIFNILTIVPQCYNGDGVASPVEAVTYNLPRWWAFLKPLTMTSPCWIVPLATASGSEVFSHQIQQNWHFPLILFHFTSFSAIETFGCEVLVPIIFRVWKTWGFDTACMEAERAIKAHFGEFGTWSSVGMARG